MEEEQEEEEGGRDFVCSRQLFEVRSKTHAKLTVGQVDERNSIRGINYYHRKDLFWVTCWWLWLKEDLQIPEERRKRKSSELCEPHEIRFSAVINFCIWSLLRVITTLITALRVN